VTETLVRLDARTLAELARPFAPAAIKFKVQSVSQDKTKGLASWYIDARLAAERLNEVVGVDNWTDEYRVLASGIEGAGMFFPVECRLTVCGVTKVDVGQYAHNAPDDKAFKSAYSDALKRAAVKSRIGAYLYTLPSLWAEVRVGGNGKVQGFTKDAETQLRGQYERWLNAPANKYGEPFDHGDVVGESDISSAAGVSTGEQAVAAPPPSSPGAATAANGFTFPSGKHAGKTLDEVDASYLDWYLANGPRDDVKQAINDFRGAGAFATAAAPDDSDIPFMPTADGGF
jgi:hypothetical protein